MGALSCNVANCVNNAGGLCTARSIHIKGKGADTSRETECDTFGERNINNALSNIANMNFAGELMQSLTNSEIKMSPIIVCDAVNCKFNSNRRCEARNIQVYGEGVTTSRETQCETFKLE